MSTQSLSSNQGSSLTPGTLTPGTSSPGRSDSETGSIIAKVSTELDDQLGKASVQLEKAGNTISEMFGEWIY